jgi:hypothetical protein
MTATPNPSNTNNPLPPNLYGVSPADAYRQGWQAAALTQRWWNENPYRARTILAHAWAAGAMDSWDANALDTCPDPTLFGFNDVAVSCVEPVEY